MNDTSTVQTKKRKVVQKWGFGMAPVSSRMRERYDRAVQSVKDFSEGKVKLDEKLPDSFSELKGMFNRCVRQDQWDWFTVYSEFGRPPVPQMRLIAEGLTLLRSAYLDGDEPQVSRATNRLSSLGLLELIRRYQRKPEKALRSGKSGWLYIISTREQPNVLKIGMTQRPVEERIKEINSATGVAIPFSARSVFSVNDARVAEQKAFEQLDSFRIRSDREFFQMPHQEAAKIIRECLKESGLLERPKRPTGTLAWVDHERGYGFVDYDGEQSVFLHFSEVPAEEKHQLNKGAELEFDLRFSEKGTSAVRATVVSNVQTSLEGAVG